MVRLLLSPWPRDVSKGPEKAVIFIQLLSIPWTILGSIPAGSYVYNSCLHSLFHLYWIMDNKAVLSLDLLFWTFICYTAVLGHGCHTIRIFFFFCYSCLRYTFKFTITLTLWVILKVLFNFNVYKLCSLLEKTHRLRGRTCKVFNKIKLNSEIKILFKSSYEYDPQKAVFQLCWVA